MGIFPNIHNFRGDETISFEEWLEGFEDSVALYSSKLLERQRIALLKIHLEGYARHYYDSLATDEKASYDSACSSLLNRFQALENMALAQNDMRKLNQANEESACKYAERVF